MGLDADSVLVPLFPAEFASDDSDAAVDTNAVEVSTGFAPRLAALNRLVAQRWSSDGGVRGSVECGLRFFLRIETARRHRD